MGVLYGYFASAMPVVAFDNSSLDVAHS